jgi:hypothetical protein
MLFRARSLIALFLWLFPLTLNIQKLFPQPTKVISPISWTTSPGLAGRSVPGRISQSAFSCGELAGSPWPVTLTVTDNGENEVPFELGNLLPGIYLLDLQADGCRAQRKLMIGG